MGPRKVVVGCRESPLSLHQAEEVLAVLRRAHPHLDLQIATRRTLGDKERTTPLENLGRVAFVKELEVALLWGSIDLAVHSLKDMPTDLPRGLTIGAVAPRGDPRDALVDRWNVPLRELPQGVRIGTSSPRRAAQLRQARPDLVTVPLRGNIHTRLRKAKGIECDGAVLAAAGLIRLGLAGEIAEFLPVEPFVPAVGQGAIAVEVRADRSDLRELLAPVHHLPTWWAVSAERAFLEAMGGGCTLPLAAHAWTEEGKLRLIAFAVLEGGQVLLERAGGAPEEAAHLGVLVAQRLLVKTGAEAGNA